MCPPVAVSMAVCVRIIASTTANVVLLSIAAAYFFAFGSRSLPAACTAHARTHARTPHTHTLHLHCYTCTYMYDRFIYALPLHVRPTAIRAEAGAVQGVGHQTSQYSTSLATLPAARVAVGQ